VSKTVYRYTYRTRKQSGKEVPPFKTTSGEQIFTKEGNAWVLYSAASVFPYEAYEIRPENVGKISTGTEYAVKDFKSEQKKAYAISLRLQNLEPPK
jgi:hypothetical protein